MRTVARFLTGNYVIDLCILSWLVAQALKCFISCVRDRKWDWRYLVSSGGMPSSHSSVVCTCAVAVGGLAGWTSIPFAVAAILAFVVMYDAANVRQAAGEQAKILNYIMDRQEEMRPDFHSKDLKELLGHTPLQVLAGAVLGILIGAAGLWRADL